MEQELLDNFISMLRCEHEVAISIDGVKDIRAIDKFSFSKIRTGEIQYVKFTVPHSRPLTREIVNFDFDKIKWEICSCNWNPMSSNDIFYNLVSEKFESLIADSERDCKIFNGRIVCRIAYPSQFLYVFLMSEEGSDSLRVHILDTLKKYLIYEHPNYILHEPGMLTKSAK